MSITAKDLLILRKKAGLSQSELASKLGNGGYNSKVVAAIENGKRQIGLKLLSQWADACDRDVVISFPVKNKENHIETITEKDITEMSISIHLYKFLKKKNLYKIEEIVSFFKEVEPNTFKRYDELKKYLKEKGFI